MGSIVAPIFPEPVTVTGNAADQGHFVAVRFIRAVATLHLLSLLLVAGALRLWLEPAVQVWLAGTIDAELLYILTIVLCAGLALSRERPAVAQTIILLATILVVTAWMSLWASLMHDSFPLFVNTFAIGFGIQAAALLVFLWASGRDLSLFGAFALVWPVTCAFVIGTALLTEISFSEGLTLLVVLTCMLFYWVYDIAMLLRRRRPNEVVAGAVDLYRDVFNFIGLPVRFMRMPRTIRRIPAPW
ncbi:MAG: hypothetical protein C4341_04065 [Armatimonadota bacterium]